jgi:hypothetical protein
VGSLARIERRLDLVDAQLVLASLAALEGSMAVAGAEAPWPSWRSPAVWIVCSGCWRTGSRPAPAGSQGVGAGVPAASAACVQPAVRELVDAEAPGFARVPLTEREDL